MDNALFPDIGKDPEDMAREEILAHFKRLRSLAIEYLKSEEALRLDEARLEALQTLNDMALAPEREIIAYSLEEAIRLTGSRIGWAGALGGDETTLIMYCWSRGTGEGRGISDQPRKLSVGDGGIWMEPIVQRKPVIVNDYAGYPKKGISCGRVAVTRFMGIPVHDGARIVAVAEVGNKAVDYDQSDLRQLSLLMSGVWRIIMRKRAEEALSESRAQAELYVDFMGHDINNMNQVAMGFLELALEKLGRSGRLEGDDARLLERPMEAIRKSSKLIDNVKKLQRLRAGMLAPILLDLGPVLRGVKSEALRMSDRPISIDYDPSEGCWVKANELLADVFSNIVGNSVRHSCPDKPVSIAIRVFAAGEWYRVTIEDDGPGIPDARKGQIFDRFAQGKAGTLRTGLGLSLVKMLVDGYRGRIWVEDRVGGDHTRGCRFVVLLPRADGGEGARCGPHGA